MAKKFAVSVANVVARDTSTGNGLFWGTTSTSTAVNMAMTATDVRGGINNVMQARYMHDKTITCTITKPTFSKVFLPLNAGSDIQNKNIKVLQTECIALDASGKGELSKTPVGRVSVFYDEDTVTVVDASQKEITVVGGKGKMVTAIYDAMETVDVLSIETKEPPKVVDLTLIIEIRNEAMELVEYLHYNIPRFQIDGNYELALSADGVSSETLTGTALNVSGQDCTSGDVYAYVKWVPVLEDALSEIGGVVITNGDITATHGVQKTVQLNVIGLRGGVKGDIEIPATDAKLGFAVAAKPAATGSNISVGAKTGIVTIATGAQANDNAVITVTYTNGGTIYKDSILVTVS